MGSVVVSGCYLALTAYCLLLLLLSCYVTFATIEKVWHQVNHVPLRVDSLHTIRTSLHRLSVMQSNHRKINRTNLIFIGASSVLYTVCLASNVAYYLVVYWKTSHQSKRFVDRAKWTSSLVLLWISDFSLTLGYTSLTVAYTGRYQSTFSNTRFRFSDRTVTVVYACIAIASASVSLGSVLANLQYRLASVLVLLVFLAVWFPLMLWLVRSFFQSMYQISADVVQSGSITPKTDQRAKDLLETSLRLTILSSVAICSTWILVLTSLAAAWVRNSLPLVIIQSALYNLDSLVNNFSLLCTFQDYRRLYHMIFGELHQWLFSRIV